MKRVKYIAWMMAIILAVVFSLISSPQIMAQETKKLSMGTGGTGGVYYIVGGGIAKVLSRYVPNLEVTVEVTAGSADNCKLLKAQKADLGLSQGDVCLDALNGLGKFGKGRAEDRIAVRALAAVYINNLHIVTHKDSPINSVKDLKGKRVSTGAPGSGTEIKVERVIEAFGLNPNQDLKRERLGASESANAFKDRKLDAYFWDGGLPTSSVLDLAATPGISIKLLNCAEGIPAMEKIYPGCYFPVDIPKGTYPSIDYDVKSIGVTNLFFTSEKFDEKMAYELVKCLYDHIRPDMVAVHKEAEKMTLQTMVTGVGIPFHPGALRFYKEKGAIK